MVCGLCQGQFILLLLCLSICYEHQNSEGLLNCVHFQLSVQTHNVRSQAGLFVSEEFRIQVQCLPTSSSGLVLQQACVEAVQGRSWEAVWKAACYRSGGEVPDGEGGPPHDQMSLRKRQNKNKGIISKPASKNTKTTKIAVKNWEANYLKVPEVGGIRVTGSC